MKNKEIIEELEIPEGVETSMDKITFKVKGTSTELSRKFFYPGVNISIKQNKITLDAKKPTKREKRMIGTFKSHIKNMLYGASNKFVYKLKICSGHFPMSVAQSDQKIIIKNFLGEKIPRQSKILPDTTVKIEGDLIIVESNNKEYAGQTAANLEKATRISKRDRRRFQDGIYITEKPKIK